jgi:cell division protein FtsL
MTIEQGLRAKVDDLEKQIVALNLEIIELKKVRARRLLYPLIMVFVSMFLAVGLSVVYTHGAVAKVQQDWCELMTGINTRYEKTPPTDEGGIEFAADVKRLLVKLNCK